MPLFRVILLLLGGLVLMLAVVMVRSQTTRLHYEIANCVREADGLRQQILEAEMALARLKNPMRLRQKVEEVVVELEPEAAAPVKAPAKTPAKASEKGPTKAQEKGPAKASEKGPAKAPEKPARTRGR